MFTKIKVIYLDETETLKTDFVRFNMKRIDLYYIDHNRVIIETGGKAWETTLNETEFLDLYNESLTITQN